MEDSTLYSTLWDVNISYFQGLLGSLFPLVTGIQQNYKFICHPLPNPLLPLFYPFPLSAIQRLSHISDCPSIASRIGPNDCRRKAEP